MAFRYAGFTVMMPEYTPDEAASLLGKLGYDGIEWRVYSVPAPGAEGVCVARTNKATLDIENIVQKAEEIRRMSEDNGLEIMGLGTYLNYKFLDDVERCMEAAKLMDCPAIRVSTPKYSGSLNYNDLYEEAVEGYSKVEDLAGKYGVRATIEVRPGNICSSASLAYRFVSNFDPDKIGVVYDPGNLVTEGYENWQMGLELLGPYLSHIHVKNTAWVEMEAHEGEKLWKNVSAPMKEGFVPWRMVMSILDKVGFKGWLSLEDFMADETAEKLAVDIEYLKSIEQELGI